MNNFTSQIRAAMNQRQYLILSTDANLSSYFHCIGLKKATMGMFQAVKEIAYKIRTVQCDKYTCYVQERGELVILTPFPFFSLLPQYVAKDFNTNSFMYPLLLCRKLAEKKRFQWIL